MRHELCGKRCLKKYCGLEVRLKRSTHQSTSVNGGCGSAETVRGELSAAWKMEIQENSGLERACAVFPALRK